MKNVTLEDILTKILGTVHVVFTYGEDIFFGSQDDFYSFDFGSADLYVVGIEADPAEVDTVLVTVAY